MNSDIIRSLFIVLHIAAVLRRSQLWWTSGRSAMPLVLGGGPKGCFAAANRDVIS